MEVSVWTRSPSGGTFSIFDSNKTPIVEKVMVQHTGPDDPTAMATEVAITKERIAGPKTIKIKLALNKGMSLEKYLVAYSVYPL